VEEEEETDVVETTSGKTGTEEMIMRIMIMMYLRKTKTVLFLSF